MWLLPSGTSSPELTAHATLTDPIEQQGWAVLRRYETAAAQGVPAAMAALGELCERGEAGVTRDVDRALHLYRTAAGDGHTRAASLAACLLVGTVRRHRRSTHG